MFERNLTDDTPNPRLVVEVPYVSTAGGSSLPWFWIHRRIVGWPRAQHQRTEVVVAPLDRALGCGAA